MKLKIIARITALMVLLSTCANTPNVHLSVQVINEANKPVEGVLVKGGFSTLMLDYVPGPMTQGITDKEGKVDLTGPAYFSVRVVANKDGYYQSEVLTSVNVNKDRDISILVRPKVNPIKMYVKSIKLQPVVFNKSFGYDFMIGDYVTPHGKGKISDLIIKIQYTETDFWNHDYYLSIRFSNKNDGLLPFFIKNKDSKYKSDYIAPLSGYKNEWEFKYISRKEREAETNLDPMRNYYVRVRSVTNNDGQIVFAYYGKIYGEFPEIVHYLNPTINDRNVEFKANNSLLTNFENNKYIFP